MKFQQTWLGLKSGWECVGDQVPGPPLMGGSTVVGMRSQSIVKIPPSAVVISTCV
jgi:hypothetical protein